MNEDRRLGLFDDEVIIYLINTRRYVFIDSRREEGSERETLINCLPYVP